LNGLSIKEIGATNKNIRGYEKKENQTFDEFWGSKGFDKYLKTCLWNVKNSKGAKITKKYPITKGTVDVVGNEEVLQREDKSLIAPETEMYIKEINEILTKDQSKVVRCILDDPKYIKPSGKVNKNALAKELDKTWNEVNALISQIGNKIENDL
jgi:cellobiose-specific phosphotransferase system component IIB